MNEFEEKLGKFPTVPRRIDKYGYDTTPKFFYGRNPVTQQQAEQAAQANEPDSLWTTSVQHFGNGLKDVISNELYTAIGFANEKLKNIGAYGDPDAAGADEYLQQALPAAQAEMPKAVETLQNNEFLKPVQVNDGDSTTRQILGAVIENIPQYGVSTALGPLAPLFMARQLYGSGTKQGTERGMDLDLASKAGFWNVGVQQPLDYLGMVGPYGKTLGAINKVARAVAPAAKITKNIGKLAKSANKMGGWLSPAGGMNVKRSPLRAVAEGLISEAPTEFIQEYGEQGVLDYFDPKVSREQLMYNVTTNPKTFRNAAMAGVVGGLMGGAAGGVSSLINNRRIDNFNEQAGRLTKQVNDYLEKHPEAKANQTANAQTQTASNTMQQEQPSYVSNFSPDVQAAMAGGFMGGASSGFMGGASSSASAPINNGRIDEYSLQQERLTEQVNDYLKKNPEAKANQTANEQTQTASSTMKQEPPSYVSNFSPDVQAAIQKYATPDVPPAVVAAIIQQESRGNPNAESYAGAQGLMQLMPGTAADLGVENPFNVDENVRGGVQYFSQMKAMFNGNIVAALAAYNRGHSYVKAWLNDGTWDGTLEHADQIPVKETREYVKDIMHNLAQSGGQGTQNVGVQNAGYSVQEQVELIRQQEAATAQMQEEYNRYANSEMARDYALELSRTSTDPALVNQVQDAVRVGDNAKLEKIARENGYKDQDFTVAEEEEETAAEPVVFSNRLQAANSNIHTGMKIPNGDAYQAMPAKYGAAADNVIQNIADVIAGKRIANANLSTVVPQEATPTVERTLPVHEQQAVQQTVHEQQATPVSHNLDLPDVIELPMSRNMELSDQMYTENLQGRANEALDRIKQNDVPPAEELLSLAEELNTMPTTPETEAAKLAFTQAANIQSDNVSAVQPKQLPAPPNTQDHLALGETANQEMPPMAENAQRGGRIVANNAPRLTMLPPQMTGRLQSDIQGTPNTATNEHAPINMSAHAPLWNAIVQDTTAADKVKSSPKNGDLSIVSDAFIKPSSVLTTISAPESGSAITFTFKDGQKKVGSIKTDLNALLTGMNKARGNKAQKLQAAIDKTLYSSSFFEKNFEQTGNNPAKALYKGNKKANGQRAVAGNFAFNMYNSVDSLLAGYHAQGYDAKIGLLENAETAQEQQEQPQQEVAQEQQEEQPQEAQEETQETTEPQEEAANTEQTEKAAQEQPKETTQAEEINKKTPQTEEQETVQTEETQAESPSANELSNNARTYADTWKWLVNKFSTDSYTDRPKHNPKNGSLSYSGSISKSRDGKISLLATITTPENGSVITFTFKEDQKKTGSITIDLSTLLEHITNFGSENAYGTTESVALKRFLSSQYFKDHFDPIQGAIEHSHYISSGKSDDQPKAYFFSDEMGRAIRSFIVGYHDQGYDAQVGLWKNEEVAKTEKAVDNNSKEAIKEVGGEADGRNDARANVETDTGIHEEAEQSADARSGEVGHRADGGDRVGRVRKDTRGARGSQENTGGTELLDRTQKGDEHLAYIDSLPYTVQVGKPRQAALEKQGKDTSLKGITEEERTKAQEQLAAHGQLLMDWAKKNGVSKDHATAERKKLQEKIVNDYYNKGSYAKGKQAFLILGLPAAGKSSLADPLADNMDAIIVDSDEFKKRLPEFANGAGANYLHEESSDMANSLLEQVIDGGDNLVFPVVGKTPKSLQEKITLLKQAGYDVHLGYMDLPMDEALLRATNRYILEGRLVNLEYIQSVGDRPLKNFNAIKNNPDITDYALYSNDVPFGEKPKLIEGTDYLSKRIDSGEKAVNNKDTKAVNSDDTSRTESGRTIEGSGSETSRERSTEAKRGMGQEHLVSGERAAVLRAGEDQDDGSVRDRDTDDLRSGEETAGERVSERGHNVSRRDDTGGTGVSSARGTVGGGDDATSRSTRHADGSTESVGRSSGNDERTGSGQPDEQAERVEQRPKPKTIRRGRFYSTEEARQTFAEETQSAGKRMEYNKDAINTYLRLTDNGRIKDMADIVVTPDDLTALSRFTGWGGLGTQVRRLADNGDEWLTSHFTDEEITAMRNSTETAYFTPPNVVSFMWNAIEKMGLQKNARVLEPSMGIGNFVMQLPNAYKDEAHVTGIELDTVTGNMAQLLYGADAKTNIRVEGYEKNRSGDNSFDLVIGNVPFSTTKFKSGEIRFDRLKPFLHDFFFLKAVKQTRPGGVVAFITTSGTMDKADGTIRRMLASEADLVAAYRLPQGTFPGTNVVADILFLQKRAERLDDVSGVDWVRTKDASEVGFGFEDKGIYINEYFISHPENVLGRFCMEYNSRFGKYRATVSNAADTIRGTKEIDSAKWFGEKLESLPEKIIQARSKAIKEKKTISTEGTRATKRGSIFMRDGQAYRTIGREAQEISDEELGIKTAADRNKVAGLLQLAQDYRELLDTEAAGGDGTELRKRVQKGYKIARKGNKSIRSSKAYKAIIKAGDGSVSILSSIENRDGKPNPILDQPMMRVQKKIEKPNVAEAVIISSVAGNIDIAEIADLTKQSKSKVKSELIKQDLAYITPNGNWETKEKYINGNIAEKLNAATDALKYGNKDMKRNIEALNKVLPERVPMNAVTVGFGASWVEPEIYTDFIVQELYGKDVDEYKRKAIDRSGAIKVSMAGGAVSVNVNINALPGGHNARGQQWYVSTLGERTKDITINNVISAALGNKEIAVRRPKLGGEKGEWEIDEERTGLANSMVQRLNDDWQEFIRTGQHRDHLADSYNYRFNSFYTPKFDGSNMTFPGMRGVVNGNEFSLRKHQKDAVYKGLMQGRGLFAHEVGTGKTYVMGALAMESKRLGLAKKTLVLAKTANYKAVAEDMQKEYPGAKIIVLEEKGNNAGGQLAETMIGDWDIVVAPHSQMSLFLLSDEGYNKAENKIRQEIREQLESIADEQTIPSEIWKLVDGNLRSTDDEVKVAMRKLKRDGFEVKELVQSLAQQLRLLEKYGNSVAEAKHIPFEQLGIDQILIDEAHEFKKPGIVTKSEVKGIETGSSDMALKLRMLTEDVTERYGRGVYMFTGTPITNTATELYQMMRYVMKPEMEAAGISSFDSWFATYAQAESSLTKKPTGEYEDEVRFIGFKNLPELQRMYNLYFDFVKTKDMPEFQPRKVKGYTLTDENIPDAVKKELENGRTENADDVPYHRILNVRSEMTDEMKLYTEEIERAARRYAKSSGKVKKELQQKGDLGDPLVAMRKLSQLSLDPRLVGIADYAGSKIQNCADNILAEYQKHDKVSQAVFLQEGVSDERTVVARDNKGFVVRDKDGKPIKEKAAGWNVAKALKDELINRGIPEKEIAILSSDAKALADLKRTYKEKYNLSRQPSTDDLKKLVAEEVSECKIKVIIGTRSMLGTGINMQHNLKAIHQLDAPWMPGELAQSQGRAVRQKNQWNTVTEYRYITDLDAVRWTRLAIKASFIAAITDNTNTQRTLEMDESMGSTVGGAEGDIYLTLSAAAQDNRLMEQKRLDKKVKKLESAQKVFYRSKEMQEAEAIRAKDLIKEYKAKLSTLKALDKAKTDGDLIIEGRGKDEKELDALRKLESRLRMKDAGRVKLATYQGLDIYGERDFFKTRLTLAHGSNEIDLKTVDGSISGATLRALVNNELGKQIKASETGIANSQRAIDTWKTEKTAKFTGEEALNKARARRDAIIADIKRNPDKPPAWLVQGVRPNSTVKVDGKSILIRSYFVGKNKAGEPIHFLIDDAGDAYHISKIRDYKTGLNPYEEEYLAKEPKDITPVYENDNTEVVGQEEQDETKGEQQGETQGETQDETKYSTVNESNTDTYRYSKNDVQDAFKGQAVKQTNNGYEVAFAGGGKLVITETGELHRADGKRVRGSYRDGVITLTDMASPFTLGHEKLHFAKDVLYTPKEWSFIDKATRKRLAKEGNANPTELEVEERAADWYAEWEQKRSKPAGALQRLFVKLKDFLAKLTNLAHGNANAQFSKLHEGKLYGRNWTDNKGKQLKYSTVEETNDAIDRTEKDIREDSTSLFSGFTAAMDRVMQKRGLKEGKNVSVKADVNSFNWFSHTLMTPDHLAKSNETLRVFTSLGKDASRELQQLRNEVDEKMEQIADGLKTDKERKLYNRIIEDGELDGTEYTAEELRKEGVSDGVINAYLGTRQLYDEYYRRVDETKRNMTTYHRVVTAKELQALRDDKFVERLTEKKLANGKYDVRFSTAQQHLHAGKGMSGKELRELYQSKYAKVGDVQNSLGERVEQKDIVDNDTYRVNYVSINEPMHKVKGYFHHMFSDWSVYEKATDPTGKDYYTQVASYRSRKDAVMAFNKMQELLDKSKERTYTREELAQQGYDNGVITAYEQAVNDNTPVDSREYVIRPKSFHFPANSGVALSTVKYERAIQAIEDKYEVSSAEARELARGILKRKAGHRFLGSTMERTGEKGYSLDMLRVLRMYTTQATRYVALEKFKNNAYREFEKFFGVPVDESKGGGLEFYIKKYIDDVNGNPTRIEDIANAQLNWMAHNRAGRVLGLDKFYTYLGTDRPAMVLANAEMQAAAVLKLGLLNLSSAAINLTQLMNSVTILGVKPLIKAHWAKDTFTKAERKFLKDVGVDTQLGLETGAGYDRNRSDDFTKYALAPFTWSEQKVRQITALMALGKAKKEGMSYAQAVKLARDTNDEANFDYGVNNAPLFIRAGGPVTQMMFQFMKFPVNQISFMMNTARNGTNEQRARLMIPIIMAGAYGVPGWAAIICPFLAAMLAAACGDDYEDPELYLKKKCYEWADGDPFWTGFVQVGFHGLPALANMDIGRRMGVGDFGGDVSKTIRRQKYGYDFGDFLTSVFGGVTLQSILQAQKQLDYGNDIEAIKAMSPALGNIAQAIVGERRTTRGRLAATYNSTSTRVMKALGFKPLDETIETEKARMIQEERSIKRASDAKLIDAYIRALEAKDEKRMQELLTELKNRKITAKRVNSEIKRKRLSQLERAIENEGSKEKRRRAQERFNW